MANCGRVLIYGGRGALGSTCIKLFKSNNWWVGSVDVNRNEEADANIVIESLDSWTAQEADVLKKVTDALNGEKLDAILCVAGGWAGGSSSSKDFIKNADLMIKQSVWSSGVAAKLATIHLKEGGLLTLPGAKAALTGTPGMIGYGLAKAAVHHLTKSLAEEKSGLPKNSTVVAFLPITLDTPMNRKFMPNADFATWTPLEFVADLSYKWASNANDRPVNGSLVQLITDAGETKLVVE